MLIRPLDPISDRAGVDSFFQEASDYITVERGPGYHPEVTQEFFTDAPPGCDPAASLRLGLFAGTQLTAVGEAGFGYPEADDAYIGLMIVSPNARGKGAGPRLLSHIENEARTRACKAIYLAVLEANPRGRAFWERMGFTTMLTGRPVTLGSKTQMARRMGKSLRPSALAQD